MRPHLALFLGFILPASLPVLALAEEDDWQVNKGRGPTVNLAFDTSEGTWISVDVSPDGERLAFDLLGHIYEMPITGGEAKPLTQGRSWNGFPRYSPDGTKLLMTSDRGGSEDLWTLDLESGEFKNVTDLDLPVFQGTWSLDGRHVYGTALNMRVRFPVYKFNLHGTKQELIPANGRSSVVHFQESAPQNACYFEHQDQSYPRSGPRIKRYDLETGEIKVEIERPGGGANPTVSPQGQRLAFVHRDDKENVLIIRDLRTSAERVVVRGLDRGRMESRYFYGVYPNMDWNPNGTHIYFSMGGGIHEVNVQTGEVREIPFSAPVKRKMDKTLRFQVEIPEDKARTRSHRWGQPVDGGILFEALGDLYLLKDGERVNLTNSDLHETNPVYDRESRRIFYAGWDDDDWGSLYSLSLDDGTSVRYPEGQSQFGSIALSGDGTKRAYIRGDGSLQNGTHLERQTGFELHISKGILPDSRVPGLIQPVMAPSREPVTDIEWHWNRYAKRPPTVMFGPDDLYIYFTEFLGDTLILKRIRPDGLDEKLLIRFPRATQAVLSPDLKWIAFREYHRTFVSPFEFTGKVYDVSAADDKGFTQRVDAEWDGDFTEWNAEGTGLYWTRGRWFCEKSLADILSEKGETRRTDISFEYDLDTPRSIIALTGVRVLTMNSDLEVLENATVLVEENWIAAVGQDMDIPEEARVFDLSGATVMPGMFDAHGHYGSPISALNVIEQRPYGLHANLAYGVTTMFDVYGTTQKDFWISDMLRAGKIAGPRIYSVGDPIFVTKYRSKMHRPIKSLDDALEHARFNQDHGATALKDYSNHTRAARQQLAAACRELELNLVTESFGNPMMNFTQIIDGYTGIEHTPGLTPLYDDVRKLFGASEVGMTPTLIVVYGGPSGESYFYQTERLWEDPKLLRFFRKDELFDLRRPTHYWDDDLYHPVMAAELHKLHQAGVLLQMGAHGQMMGLGAHWEMEMFVHGGFTPLEAIQVATLNGFRHHGLDHELGSIEVGKLADLVVLRDNPLVDIRNTRSIRYVMKNGRLYNGDDASEVYPDPGTAKPFYFMTKN